MDTGATRPGATGLIEKALLEAARRVFAEQGYEGASVDAVAAEAGLTKGAVYSRFASKEELFLALLSRRDEDVLDRVEGSTPALLAASWRAQLPEDRMATLLGTEFRLYGLRHPDARPHVRRWQRQSHQRLAGAIERWMSEVGVRLRIPSADAAAVIAAVTAGLAHQWYIDQRTPAERLLRAVLELLVHTDAQ